MKNGQLTPTDIFENGIAQTMPIFSALFICTWWYVALTFQTLYTKILWYSNKSILPSRLNVPLFSHHPFSRFLLGTIKCATTTNIAHNIDLSLFQSWNKSNNNNNTTQKYIGESLSEYTQNERCYKNTERRERWRDLKVMAKQKWTINWMDEK